MAMMMRSESQLTGEADVFQNWNLGLPKKKKKKDEKKKDVDKEYHRKRQEAAQAAAMERQSNLDAHEVVLSKEQEKRKMSVADQNAEKAGLDTRYPVSNREGEVARLEEKFDEKPDDQGGMLYEVGRWFIGQNLRNRNDRNKILFESMREQANALPLTLAQEAVQRQDELVKSGIEVTEAKRILDDTYGDETVNQDRRDLIKLQGRNAVETQIAAIAEGRQQEQITALTNNFKIIDLVGENIQKHLSRKDVPKDKVDAHARSINATFLASEVGRTPGMRNAVSMLTGVPLDDPDYDKKVLDILSKGQFRGHVNAMKSFLRKSSFVDHFENLEEFGDLGSWHSLWSRLANDMVTSNNKERARLDTEGFKDILEKEGYENLDLDDPSITNPSVLAYRRKQGQLVETFKQIEFMEGVMTTLDPSNRNEPVKIPWYGGGKGPNEETTIQAASVEALKKMSMELAGDFYENLTDKEVYRLRMIAAKPFIKIASRMVEEAATIGAESNAKNVLPSPGGASSDRATTGFSDQQIGFIAKNAPGTDHNSASGAYDKRMADLVGKGQSSPGSNILLATPNLSHLPKTWQQNIKTKFKSFAKDVSLILVGQGHAEWNLALKNEDEADRKVVKGPGGRFYSVSKKWKPIKVTKKKTKTEVEEERISKLPSFDQMFLHGKNPNSR
jgi:hypothetical protein